MVKMKMDFPKLNRHVLWPVDYIATVSSPQARRLGSLNSDGCYGREREMEGERGVTLAISCCGLRVSITRAVA